MQEATSSEAFSPSSSPNEGSHELVAPISAAASPEAPTATVGSSPHQLAHSHDSSLSQQHPTKARSKSRSPPPSPPTPPASPLQDPLSASNLNGSGSDAPPAGHPSSKPPQAPKQPGVGTVPDGQAEVTGQGRGRRRATSAPRKSPSTAQREATPSAPLRGRRSRSTASQ